MITSAMLARQIILPRPSPTKLTPLLRYACSLLPLFLRVASFVFNSLQPLLPKTGGWGSLAQVISNHARRPHRFFTPLFSWSYGLLFSQPLSFQKHLRCPIVFSKSSVAFPNQEFSALLRVLCDSALSFSFASSEPFKRSDIPTFGPFSARMLRSEEHTSELQSRSDLVCRLLLEK